MASTLDYIVEKFELDLTQKLPISILNINRVIMAQTLAELGFKVGVEIGVAKGEHAEILCKNNPNLMLYGVDPWIGYTEYKDYKDETLSKFYKEAVSRLSSYNCTLIRSFSMDALSQFPDKSLDFVYIDGAHDFKSIANDIYEWPKKVRKDGIVFGHDFERKVGKYQKAVQDIVPVYCYLFQVRPWFILGTRGEADGRYREGVKSWMFVNNCR